MHSKHVKSFYSKKFLVIMVALLVILFIDTSLVKITDLIDTSFIPLEAKLTLFSVSISLSLALQYFILRHIKGSFESDLLKRSFKVQAFYKTFLATLVLLAIVTGALIFQMFYYDYYYTFTSIFLISLSYGIASVFIILLSFSFFSWYKSKHNLIVLLYFLAMLTISFNLIITAIFVSEKVNLRPDPATQYIGSSGDISGGINPLLENIYKLSSFGSFFSIWLTTAILMNYYRDKLFNAIAYWVLLSIPLVYFMMTYFYQFLLSSTLSSYLQNDPVTVSILLGTFLSLSKPVGGLMFGIVFWKISRNMRYEKNIRIYMVISGWGIFLIFSANQAATQIVGPYPPFGLATVTTLCTGAFLMLIGIYNSAALVSTNNELRRFIHRQTLESRLLSVIGSAEMEKEIEKTISKITQDTGKLETNNDEPINLDQEELKKYLDLVLREVKKGDKTSGL